MHGHQSVHRQDSAVCLAALDWLYCAPSCRLAAPRYALEDHQRKNCRCKSWHIWGRPCFSPAPRTGRMVCALFGARRSRIDSCFAQSSTTTTSVSGIIARSFSTGKLRNSTEMPGDNVEGRRCWLLLTFLRSLDDSHRVMRTREWSESLSWWTTAMTTRQACPLARPLARRQLERRCARTVAPQPPHDPLIEQPEHDPQPDRQGRLDFRTAHCQRLRIV